MIGTLVLAVALAALPVAQQEAETTPPIDFEAAVELAAMKVVAEDTGAELVWIQERDPETGQFVSDEAGYWTMLYSNSYDPATLAFFGASVAEMYSNSVLQNQCAENSYVSCTNPFPGTVQENALITAGVYMGVTGLQRLAKKHWDVELDEGWKNVLIWGGMAAVRSLVTAANISDANALRELR